MIFGDLIYSTISSREKVEKHQQKIRDFEWRAIKKYIPKKSTFLDVGCGAGYSMMRAKIDFECKVSGIDPSPGNHGVGRYLKELITPTNIEKGEAEKLPFKDKSFDVIYSSHVLEHVSNISDSLSEMGRVLNKNGVVILGMPTSSMAIINLISNLLFKTHIKIYEFLRNIHTKDRLVKFKKIFRIGSHSYPLANSIWYDIKFYNIRNWKRLIQKEFRIIDEIKPCFYPFPDYPQFFNIHKNPFFSSSVFFICQKKK